MPRGRYSLHDPYDGAPLGEEHFHCAPGAAGWRYTAQVNSAGGEHAGSIDLTIDHLGRPIRLEMHASGWQVRGAALDGVTWVRSDPAGAEAHEGNAPAHAFTGQSPSFLVATARLLALRPGEAGKRVRLVALTPPVLAPRTVEQAWLLRDTAVHETDSGPLTVENYEVRDLEAGEAHEVHIAGDVVLSAPGVELETLESPPSVFAEPA
ncbi:hypothetical protein G5C51_36640 [Streptomyces sp. A7024]|uniref:Uncharacterized protein n=1 Tax=Streptomyces coryli TaxID=1128680 RepID=A0A6G4UB56_9ACTN|nr:hypothetical protein [Streptomyces coryli]NGN69404.1 hypothetical protein [Streptomyces coryli]